MFGPWNLIFSLKTDLIKSFNLLRNPKFKELPSKCPRELKFGDAVVLRTTYHVVGETMTLTFNAFGPFKRPLKILDSRHFKCILKSRNRKTLASFWKGENWGPKLRFLWVFFPVPHFKWIAEMNENFPNFINRFQNEHVEILFLDFRFDSTWQMSVIIFGGKGAKCYKNIRFQGHGLIIDIYKTKVAVRVWYETH